MSPLRILYDDIETRTATIQGSQSAWPCRKGCDDCCRRLAAIPELTRPELETMEQGISALPAHHQKAIAERLQMLSPQTPVVCPFLDQDAGACLIYEHRPAACRTYGFYVERDKGLWCGRIASADTTDVVWGNQCAVDCRLDDLGPRINLREWFKR